MSFVRRNLVLLLVLGAGCAAEPPREDARVPALEEEIRGMRVRHEQELLQLRQELGDCRDANLAGQRELVRLRRNLQAKAHAYEQLEVSRDAALSLLRQREQELAEARAEAERTPSSEGAVKLLLEKERQLQALREELTRLRAGDVPASAAKLDGAVTLAHLDLEQAIARVDAEPLSRREFLEYLYRDLAAPRLLELFLNRYLVLREGQRRGIVIDEVQAQMWVARQILDQTEQAGSEEKLAERIAADGFTRQAWEARLGYQAVPVLTLERLVQDQRGTPAGRKAWEERLAAAYQEAYSERVRARHIALPLAPDAAPEQVRAIEGVLRQARLDLERGVSFADVARRYSDDQDSKRLGGLIGTFDRQRFAELPDLNTVFFTLEVGKISPPVRSRVAMHLVLVEERLPPVRSYDQQVRRELSERLEQEPPSEGEVAVVLRDLRSRAKVETALVFDAK